MMQEELHAFSLKNTDDDVSECRQQIHVLLQANRSVLPCIPVCLLLWQRRFELRTTYRTLRYATVGEVHLARSVA